MREAVHRLELISTRTTPTDFALWVDQAIYARRLEIPSMEAGWIVQIAKNFD